MIRVFSIGDEVLFNGERHVISEYYEKTGLFRLLSVGEKGTKFAWAKEDELERVAQYAKPVNDTQRY